MLCIILYRTNGGSLEYVDDGAGGIHEFPHRDDAIAYAMNNPLFDSGQADYQIVELDEV
jgi:hypothetical protein